MIEDRITYCDCCGAVILDRNSKQCWKKTFHMTSSVIKSLDESSIIPDLCSMECCNKYVKIRNNGG